MNFPTYQECASETAQYPSERALEYVALGLLSEAGEVAGEIKKIIWDDGGEITDERAKKLEAEIGDVLWYLSQLCSELNLVLEQTAIRNIAKLQRRLANNTIKGSGSDR